jgi:small-conductance mechanosensitive channel
MPLIDDTYYNNSIKEWLLALIILVATFFILRVVKEFVAHRMSTVAKKTKNNLDDMAVRLLEKTSPLFIFFLSIYLGSLVLTLSKTVTGIIISITIIALIIQSAFWGNQFIVLWGDNYAKKALDKSPSSKTTISAITFGLKVALWSITVLILLDNLGIDITALIAGLGVGGIAVALAVQNVLGDLFASLAIVLDKPFVLGDFIIVGDYMGCVERIGLKTTHIRSLSGEQIIFSNTDLLQSRVRNYKRMDERRIVFSLGVTYDTAKEKLRAIPAMIREAVESQKEVRFDRAHFKEYGDFALLFEIVYYVLSPDYNKYMDTQQAINMTLFDSFSEKGIEFAYPTQTLYVNKGSID